MRHTPALDGIRGIAIATVVVGHAFGYIPAPVGVDLFFVLSGFLITTLLLEGHYDGLRSFYEARARRLLPALVSFLTVYVAVEAARGSNGLPAAGIALTYGANIVRATGHDGALGDIRHMWSLAMEEQFYLVWPALLLVALRRRIRPATWVLVALAVFYTAWPMWVEAHEGFTNHLLYSPDTRGVGLVIGCLAAIARQRVERVSWWAAVAALAVVVLVAWPSSNPEAPEAVTLLSVATAVVILHVVDQHTVMARLLTRRPLVWLGTVSYALYLWHLPILIWTGTYGAGSMWARSAAVAASVAAAVVSGSLVEARFRRKRAAGGKVVEGRVAHAFGG